MMEPWGVGMGAQRIEGRKTTRARKMWWMGAIVKERWEVG
jgi:hypothetical protein